MTTTQLPTANPNDKVVGQFTLHADGALSGPAAYLQERGETLLKEVLAGDDPIFNATATFSPDPTTALLVRLQTDYAGWKGTRDLMRRL